MLDLRGEGMIKIFISILLGILISICVIGIGIILIYLREIGYGAIGVFILSVIVFSIVFYKSQI